MAPRTILPLLLLMTACGARVGAARFREFPARPDNHEILVFQTLKPECSYVEVGTVVAARPDVFVSPQKALDAMKEKAREMGGDALVGLTNSETITGGTVSGNDVSMTGTPRFTATVARFKDDACRH